MITIQPHISTHSLYKLPEIEESLTEKKAITTIAQNILNQPKDSRISKKEEEIFWMRIRIKLLFNILKNNFSKLKAKILLILLILELLMSGVPIEALQEVINELIEEFKRDQKLYDKFQSLIPFILTQDVQNMAFENLFQIL